MHLLIHYFYVSDFFNTWAATVSSALMIQTVPGQRNVISTRGPVNVLLQELTNMGLQPMQMHALPVSSRGIT